METFYIILLFNNNQRVTGNLFKYFIDVTLMFYEQNIWIGTMWNQWRHCCDIRGCKFTFFFLRVALTNLFSPFPRTKRVNFYTENRFFFSTTFYIHTSVLYCFTLVHLSNITNIDWLLNRLILLFCVY